jgi:GrpB-like predicted nucleotidyltransferase (UPF0157 family)
MEAAVHIEPYNPGWPQLFLDERVLLLQVLGPWLAGPIEHIGSTAVPGMPAKPVIDIMAAVASLDASRDAIARLAEASYRHFPYRADVMHWFCKPGPELRTHHLHLVPHQSPLWRDRLYFRDRLRTDQDLAREYAALKQRLAAQYRDDREMYTELKGPFIERVLHERDATRPLSGL